MKTVISSYEDAVANAAEHIKRVVNSKPDAVLALPGSRRFRDLYSRLVKMFKNKEVCFSRVTMLVMTEYAGIPPDDARSCRSFLAQQLVELTDFNIEKCHFLSEDNADTYDDLIASLGGIDLAVAEIGEQAQLGFNGVGMEFETYTHIQKLSDGQRSQLSQDFGGQAAVPQQGVTMGIKTICSARDIIVPVWGEDMAEAVFKMLYARNDGAAPAAFLQLPFSVTAYIDGAAATKL